MKFYNIIFSPTGGVKKVSDIILNELSNDISIIDLSLRNTDFSSYEIKEDDIAIISMPSFGGRAPKIAIDRLKQIKSNSAKAILICVYGNRDYEDTLIEMKDVAQSVGFNVVASISAISEHSIARSYAKNRPDDKDKEQLKEFAQKIKERISNSTYIEPKNQECGQYKKTSNVGIIPKTTRKCVKCGKCIELCPTGAISVNNPRKIDKNKCISCTRCVSICPTKAKKISKIMTTLVTFALNKMNPTRKENELF